MRHHSPGSVVFVVALVVAVAAAGLLAVGRMQLEKRHHTVEIVLDANDVRRVAGGRPMAEALARFRAAGVTSLGVHEVTMQDLLDAGLAEDGHSFEGGVWVNVPTPEEAAALAAAIRGRLPSAKLSTDGTLVTIHDGSLDLLEDVPLLLRPGDAEAARAAGLRVVARLGNSPNITPAAIRASAAQARRAGAHLVVFANDQVLGYRSDVPVTAGVFRSDGLIYGRVEIAAQKGDEELAGLLPGWRVRVHSIVDAELETMAPGVALERYARAVRERGIRVCYVRLMTDAGDDPMADNIRYVGDVVATIRHQGFTIGPAAPLSAPAGWPAPWARPLIFLGVAAGFVLLMDLLVPLSSKASWALFAITVVLVGALAAKSMNQAVALGGLATAAVFPALGVLAALRWMQCDRPARGAGEVVRRAAAGLVLASTISFAGGLLIVGMYAEPHYLEAVGQFAGVKLAIVAPVFLVLLGLISDTAGRPESLRAWWEEMRSRLRGFFATPVVWGAATALAVALVAAALVLMRSGNDAPIAPSGAELHMRQTLEDLLIARPRTKEFLFGHPALMLALALAWLRRRTWLPFVAIIGAIGQTSLLNTFCHFHMPLYLGLLRTVNGLWLGALIGAVLVVVWQAVSVRRARVGVP